METGDSLRLIKGVVQTRSMPYHLLANATRAAVHPLERRLLDGWSFPPRSISMMITDRCNLRCRMCQYANTESPEFALNRAGSMPLDLFTHILDTCPGKPLVAITGGEPLLHPQVIEFIRAAKQRGFLCSLSTNGTCLQAHAEQLCENQPDLLVVSIDGDQELHDRIRGAGAYERAIAGIQAIMRQPDHPKVAITTVITDINWHKLSASLDLAEGLGVELLNFNHLWIHTDQMILAQGNQPYLSESGRILWRINTQAIDSECVYQSLQSIHKQKRRVIVNEYPRLSREETRSYYQDPEKLVKVHSSRCAWQTMRIYPDGQVGICREYHAGNVTEQSLREIWNNPRYRNFRRYLRENGTCPICSRCCLLFTRM